MRHGDCGQGQAAAGIQRPRNLQKMIRIVVGVGAQLQNLIVAGAFALDAQAVARHTKR